jgi:photosystem II stability/assembly factor-like uncharacterized protein
LARSDDGGQTWSAQGQGIDGLSSIRTIVVDPRDSGRLLAGTERGGVWISEDRGANWRAIGGLDGLKTRTLVVDADGGRVLAGTSDGVWRFNLP